MSDTPLSYTGSWVDLSGEVMSSGTVSPIVPLGNDSHFMRMLREAQGETSSHTSCRVSPYMCVEQYSCDEAGMSVFNEVPIPCAN